MSRIQNYTPMKEMNNIALLIDADNIPINSIEYLIDKLSEYGRITIKRIYGNWSDNRLKGWKELIKLHSFMAIQKFDFVKGKNASDISLIIDAMDILYSKKVSTFCIASSDSDFTNLAQRIKEDSNYVFGFGEKNKVSEVFINACDKFIFYESNDSSQNEVEKVITEQLKSSLLNNRQFLNNIPSHIETNQPLDLLILINSYNAIKNKANDGFVYIGEFGNTLKNNYPNFNVKEYGSATITKLLAKLEPLFAIRKPLNSTSIYIKLNKLN